MPLNLRLGVGLTARSVSLILVPSRRYLFSIQLTSVPEGVFSGLTSLETL